MKKFTEFINEEESKYYDFQIKIGKSDDGTIAPYYIHLNGKLQKISTSRSDNPLVLDYRNVPGMVKAALRKAQKDSTITIWDDSGKGKEYSFNKQSIKKIKK